MYLRRRHTAQKGFTIIELLVYIVVLIIVIGAVMSAIVGVARSYARISANQHITRSAKFLLERMTREIRDATEINGAESTLGSNPGTLVLDIFPSGASERQVGFISSGNTVLLEEDGVVTGTLLDEEVSVTNLVFMQVTTTESVGVTINLTLEASTGTGTTTATFQTTAVLRGSYIL